MSKKIKHLSAGRLKLKVQTAEVDNPYFQPGYAESPSNPRTVRAYVNVRESAIETLFARGSLDRPQKQAADRFRSLWETMGGAGAGAIDYTQEHVDGGGASDPISLRQLAAGKELKRCRILLGARGFALVSNVAGDGRSLPEVAGPTKRDRLSAADALRGFLDDLAEMWGYRNFAHPSKTVVRK